MDYQQDRILPRLARCLAEQTGWSMAATPNGRADANLFVIYIDFAQYHYQFKATPVACWFSHYDEGQELKERWWEKAAKRANLRLTSARQYATMLEKHGPTKQVRPPIVDRERYGIVKRSKSGVAVAGVSGFVPHPGNRKRPDLIAKLKGTVDGQRVRWQASGRGWPVRRQATRPVSELPAFYQSLDVFVCTSMIEGVPMPPLEALACGVSVVIPKGVGLLDDLPDVEGIYRYRVGSSKALLTAFKLALKRLDKVDRETLVAAVEAYTPENWASDVRQAMEGLLYDTPLDMSSDALKGGKRGVYYVAYGKPARRRAKHAMETFKAYMPGVEVALASTEPLDVEDIFIKHPDVDIGARCVKTKIDDLAPADWAYVMYLDADTEVVADISFLYEVLEDGWDMVICKNPVRFHVIENMVRPDNEDECRKTYKKLSSKELIQYNGGVFAFRRNERTAAFFRAWHKEWQRWGKRDQAALLRALWDHPLRLYVLTNVWNTFPTYMPKSITAGILHYPQTARRWEGVVHGRSDGKEAWKAVREWEAGRK